MRHLRFSFSLAVLAGALLAASVAQAQRARGITEIMRAAPSVPPARTQAPATGPIGQQAAEYIVALVNSEPVTNTEVQSRVRRALGSGDPEVQRMPHDVLARSALERIILEKAQLQQAKETGVKVDDLALDQAEQMVARQNNVTVAEMQRRLAADGITRESFRADLRQQLLMQRLRERELESRVKISDLEVDQYINEQRNNSDAQASAEINIAQILVAVPEKATTVQIDALKQRAEAAATRARAGEDFGALVREFSDTRTQDEDGAMGLRNAQRYPPLFVEATASLPVGAIAGPVKSDAGFHVLKLLARSLPGAIDATVPQTHARHILLRVDDKRTTAQAVAELNEFKKRLAAGSADFTGLARDNSQDGSAKQGGDLGWVRSGMFVPEFEDAMDRLQPGQVSDPVVSRFGVHLIQVLERREARLSPAEQREAVRAMLREKRLDEAYETWVQELRARAFVEYREPPN